MKITQTGLGFFVVVANLTVIPQHFCLETPDDVFGPLSASLGLNLGQTAGQTARLQDRKVSISSEVKATGKLFTESEKTSL